MHSFQFHGHLWQHNHKQPLEGTLNSSLQPRLSGKIKLLGEDGGVYAIQGHAFAKQLYLLIANKNNQETNVLYVVDTSLQTLCGSKTAASYTLTEVLPLDFAIAANKTNLDTIKNNYASMQLFFRQD